MASPPRLFGKRYSIRIYVGAFTAAFFVSAMALAGWLASQSVTSAQEQFRKDLEQKGREIVATIEREIISTQNVLIALSTSRSLQSGDLEPFHRQATKIAQQLDIQIALRDARTGQQLINTALPATALRLQPIEVPADPLPLAAGRPEISGVMFDPLTRRYQVVVVVPVPDSKAAYALCVGLPIERFASLLQLLQLEDDWIVTVTDQTGNIVARSKKQEEYGGKRVPLYSEIAVNETQSVAVGRNLEGIPFHWFNRRSQVSGWRISIGVPDQAIRAPLREATISLGLVGGALLLISVLLARLLAGRLLQSFGTLGIDRQPTREEFSSLFELAPNGVVVIDGNGLIVLKNAQMRVMFGYDQDELVGQPIEMLIPERHRTVHAEQRAAFIRASRPRLMGVGRPLSGRHKSGSEFPVEISLNPIRTQAGDLVIATIVDITARRHAEERLAAVLAEQDSLRRRLIQAEEQERLRLARELHDQTGQELTAAMLALKGLEPSVSRSGLPRIGQLQDLLGRIGTALHRVARDLRPILIDDIDPAIALAGYVSEWGGQAGVAADFHCTDGTLDEIGEEIRNAIYRIIQEALSNIAKHAYADAVSVIVSRAGGLLRLTIEDNGCGFDTATAGKRAREQFTGGLGIAGMRERVILLGGDIEIESAPGAGTTIFVRIPVEPGKVTA